LNKEKITNRAVVSFQQVPNQNSNMSSACKYLSFEEIVRGRDATVRITDDGLLFVVDLVMVVTGKSRDDSSRVLRDLPEEMFQQVKFTCKSFPGKGNGRTKLVTFQDALELIMVLPGKIAKESRVQFADIIKRYLAGDESLVKEIRANAESDSVISKLARESLDADRAETLAHKRKLEQLEIEERVVALEMKKVDAQYKQTETQSKLIDMMAKTAELYTNLCPNQEIDERGRVLLKDCVLNTLTSGRLLTNGGEPAAPATKFITISSVAAEMGLRFDAGMLIKIGWDVKRDYEDLYDEEPPKHEQIVGGAVRQVCTYQEKDRDLVADVLRRYIGAAKRV
jgi:hypothetical protein